MVCLKLMFYFLTASSIDKYPVAILRTWKM